MRIEQPEGQRGSLKWIQRLVERAPDALTPSLIEAGVLSSESQLTWLSPLRQDAWAEYRDARFLDRIGQSHLARNLKNFWPRRGPQWDALAKDQSGRVLLFEAKAHSAEMASTCQADSQSRTVITVALEKTKQTLEARAETGWLNGYYQYANRLAHLCFLRSHGVDARLVFLYFTGDTDMKGPSSREEWSLPIEAVHAHLGLDRRPRGVATVFHSVAGLA